jgi:diguanylate cyclase (GGDEF)-like protein/PAS domain S-box-containing protein
VLSLQFLLLTLATVAVGSRIKINLLRFKSNVSASDVFIFLAILLYDREAAILLGAVDSFCASLSITRKPLTRLFNSAAMACSVFFTVTIVRAGFGPAVDLVGSQYSSRLVVAICIMALVQFVTNSGIIAVAGALRAGLPVWLTWRKHYIWTSLTYFAGASAAGITARLINQVGIYAFLATIPIVAIVYFTYSTYTKNLESSILRAEQAKRHVSELKKSEERFRNAFDHAPIGMALVAPDGRWLQVNQSLCQVLGYSEDELLQMTFQEVTHPEDLNGFVPKMSQLIEDQNSTFQMEKRYLHKLGHEVWTLVGVTQFHDGETDSSRLIFQIQDITDRRHAEERLLHEAFHDSLTQLPNRAWFKSQLRAALESIKQGNKDPFAVLFLDLDRFKVINDSIGHMVGDQLLVQIAEELRESVRPGDKLARLGGDEFTVLLENVKDQNEAIEVAERIQNRISKPFNLNGFESYTTASIGIAISSEEYEKAEDILRDADTAMYQAKSLGKARHVVFDKFMHARALNLLQMETDLRRAIERQEFFIEYQPIMSLHTHSLIGFEALVRWQHPERGLISPEQFISVAEEAGLIVPIGDWVLREACFQMSKWREEFPSNPALFMSVNLSPRQFLYAGLFEQIIRTLEITGLDAHSLKLEITESALMENIESVSRLLKRLRLLGVELSIDDFGTGYSSLSYLSRLPINTLKVDRSFVKQMSGNSENKEIVRTVVLLGRSLGMQVIAEGVEDEKQLEQLRELGCDNAQGYLFSMPLAAEAAGQLIKSLQGLQAELSAIESVCEDASLQPARETYTM